MALTDLLSGTVRLLRPFPIIVIVVACGLMQLGNNWENSEARNPVLAKKMSLFLASGGAIARSL